MLDAEPGLWTTRGCLDCNGAGCGPNRMRQVFVLRRARGEREIGSAHPMPPATAGAWIVVMGSPLVRVDGSGVELIVRLGASTRVRVDDGTPPAVVLDLGQWRVVIEPAGDGPEVRVVVVALALATAELCGRLGGAVMSDG